MKARYIVVDDDDTFGNNTRQNLETHNERGTIEGFRSYYFRYTMLEMNGVAATK